MVIMSPYLQESLYNFLSSFCRLAAPVVFRDEIHSTVNNVILNRPTHDADIFGTQGIEMI